MKKELSFEDYPIRNRTLMGQAAERNEFSDLVSHRGMYHRWCRDRFIPKVLRRLSANNENSDRSGKEDRNLSIQENGVYSDRGYPSTDYRLQCRPGSRYGRSDRCPGLLGS